MAGTERQLRRGTSAQHTNFTGAEGEVTVDTTDFSLRVHDGVTKGGHSVQLAASDASDLTVTSTNATTTRTLVDRFSDVVNVKDFGAVGDGVTDDTAAIQAAINSGLLVYLPEGAYNISTTLTSPTNDQVIHGSGTLRALTQDMTMLTITGDNTIIEGLTFEGNTLAAVCVSNEGASNIIKENTFQNIYGENTGANAVQCITPSEGWVIDNKFYNLDGRDDGVIGNSIGAVRAVYVSWTTDRDQFMHIERNYIEGVLGQEGDAIHIQCTTGGIPYDSGKARIKNNTIRRCTRRAVKLQCSGCEVIGNHYSHNLTRAESPIFIAGVDALGGYHTISDNWIDGSEASYAIVIGGSGSEALGLVVTNNRLNTGYNGSSDAGWSPRSTQRCIYASEVGQSEFSNNYCIGGVNTIEIADANDIKVLNNKCIGVEAAGVAQGGGVSLTDCTYAQVSGNYGHDTTGARVYFVNITRGNNHTVTDNHVRYINTLNHACVRMTGDPARTLVKNNSSYCDTFAVVVGTSTNGVIEANNNMGGGG